MSLTARQFFSAENASIDTRLECAFFSSLKMRNGTFKLTQPSRFAGLEQELAPYVRERLPGKCSVLDIGASTGLTTVELDDFLKANGASPRIIGTDLFIDAYIIELGPGLRVLADPDGWPLQYDIGGLGLRAWIRRLDYATGAVIPRLAALRRLHPRLRHLIAIGRGRPVRMESRSLAHRPISLVESDIFVAEPDFVGQFDFIRAANILNPNNFDSGRLKLALDNIRRYARGAGALLLVVRSGRAGEHHGTLFEHTGDGAFVPLHRFGAGSEIEALITEGVGQSSQGGAAP